MASEMAPFTNRLIKEKSPYLLQHAHNPVDWYPWGKEAFKASQEQDKPIFLSIGYATCHWCHVMERESFENSEVAALMNEIFINIKVDREELPEVDSLYMEFAQNMIAGATGWPLNVILTPELKPFFAATYIPPQSLHGLMGLKELVHRIKTIWQGSERETIEEQALKIVEVFGQNSLSQGNELPIREIVEDAAEMLFKMTDPVYGGIKGAPKFPIGYQTNFMLRYAALSRDSRGLFFVERTLDMMQRGGIYDHLGGGFSRYSVDEKWLVPHFEKMLYNNALLSDAYTEAWQASHKEVYRRVRDETLEYLLREMSHSKGAFYTAEDADSEGQEGFFYTWPFDEVEQILGKKESALFCNFYGLTPNGNFEGRNILHVATPVEEFAKGKGLDFHDLEALLKLQRQVLWKAREERIHPLKDDKILSAGNGLAIHSMANAYNDENSLKFLQAAERAARFIKENLWKKGQLLRRWRDGEGLFEAGLEEYAFLIRGLLTLFEASGKSEWLEWALQLAKVLEDDFKSEDGAYYQTSKHEEDIILRRCQYSDGAEPSGNAIHCENLIRLHQITREDSYLESAEDILKAVKELLNSYPPAYCYHLMNLNRYYDRETSQIIIALNQAEEYKQELHELLHTHLIPHRAIIWKHSDDLNVLRLLPFIETYEPVDSRTTLYICRRRECQKPLVSFAEMRQALLDLS